MKKVKDENKILIMLAFFSISVGLWGNFRQLWLQDNNFTVTQIGNIISVGTFFSIIGIAITVVILILLVFLSNVKVRKPFIHRKCIF